MAYTYSNRINVSVSDKCWNEVDKVISESKLFNGRTDFVFSAVRHFYIESDKRFRDYLAEAKKEGSTPLEIITLFDEATARYCERITEIYIHYYPGPNIRQIAIRPDEDFIQELKNISNYLFKSKEMEYIVRTCRLAISEYLANINAIIENMGFLEKEVEMLRASIKKNKIDLGF